MWLLCPWTRAPPCRAAASIISRGTEPSVEIWRLDHLTMLSVGRGKTVFTNTTTFLFFCNGGESCVHSTTEGVARTYTGNIAINISVW